MSLINKLVHALRISTTGKPVGFGIFDTLVILGRKSSIDRIDRALNKAKKSVRDTTK